MTLVVGDIVYPYFKGRTVGKVIAVLAPTVVTYPAMHPLHHRVTEETQNVRVRWSTRGNPETEVPAPSLMLLSQLIATTEKTVQRHKARFAKAEKL